MFRALCSLLTFGAFGLLGLRVGPPSVFAQSVDAISLGIEFNAARTTATVTLTPSASAVGCEYALYGGNRAASLEAPFASARLLATVSGVAGRIELTAENLKRLKRGSASGRVAPLFFRARLRCGETDTLSDLERLGIPRGVSGVRTASGWLEQFGRRLVTKNVSLVDAFPALSFNAPVDLQNAADGSNRLFVVEQGGLIRAFANDASTTSASTYLDLTSKISNGGERGVLGLAFHPQFEQNGYLFVNYTKVGTGATIIARFQASPPTASSVDSATELVILEVAQPYANHNGGGLAFGPDGYLYIGLGDGGSAGDPQGNAQDRSKLLGKMLRIDVNSAADGKNYAVPSDNPYVGNTSGYREEIWAYGFRNPWRYCFDAPTGQLWLGDVGQNRIEEVDLVQRGKNYGWKTMEGSSCYEASSCDKTGKVRPVAEYTHSVGQSITGGCVYRGSQVPGLAGLYLFGDFVSGRLWSLRYDSGKETVQRELIDTDMNIAAFGRDEAGEMYLLSYAEGKIFKLGVGE